MALIDDILSGGNWVTGLAIGVGAVVVLPLAAPVLRPLAKVAIKGGILAYQGVAGVIEDIGDIVVEAAAETEQRVTKTTQPAEAPDEGASTVDDVGGSGRELTGTPGSLSIITLDSSPST
jgi:hypothetical protein